MPSAITDFLSLAPWRKSPLPTPRSRFRQLINDIRSWLGSDNSVVSSSALRHLLELQLEAYKFEDSGWEEYAFRDPSQTFTRNLVDRGTGDYNLLILVWTPGSESVIHDHADSHCIMKMLKGSLTETRYAWPQSTGPGEPMIATSQTHLDRDQVIYMADDLGLHKISNPDPEEYAVSLHCKLVSAFSPRFYHAALHVSLCSWLAVYTPPNAAIKGYKVFDPDTGIANHAYLYTYHSEFGIRCKLEART
ncbi:MAG: hypothetical protein Q9204_004156 [Flavoplaca sp. TL-2023a]